MQICHTLALALFCYANDYGGKYPDGKSSTEVFQKLVDGKYISDPAIFYVPFVGKTKWTSGKLKPENVCWDVTNGLNLNGDSDETPLIFITGFRMDYRPGGSAYVVKTYDYRPREPRTWFAWMQGAPLVFKWESLTIAWKNTGAKEMLPPSPPLPDGSIPNVVSISFDPKGKIYIQLTPDGPISPASAK